MKPVSICIPAYNEESAITTTLRSALNQKNMGEMEVLVCVNGSNDRTAERVAALARKESRVRLLEETEAGKPNAWNVLRREAASDRIFFGDADVYFEQGAFAALSSRLDRGDIIAAGANVIPYRGESFVAKMLTPVEPVVQADPLQICLIGRLYCMENTRVQERLEHYGMQHMPKDLIHEDLWLTMVLGRTNWTIDPGARVRFRQYRLSEHARIRRREQSAERQLRDTYGHILADYPTLLAPPTIPQIGKLEGWRIKFDRAATFENKAALVLGHPFRYALDQAVEVARRYGELTPHKQPQWEFAASTKQPIHATAR